VETDFLLVLSGVINSWGLQEELAARSNTFVDGVDNLKGVTGVADQDVSFLTDALLL
jgi:hypothetical protein